MCSCCSRVHSAGAELEPRLLQMQPQKKLLKYVAIIPELLKKEEMNKKLKAEEEGRHDDVLIIRLSACGLRQALICSLLE